MSKKKKQQLLHPTDVSVTPLAEVTEPVLSIEQVAMSIADEADPKFKPHHLQSVLAFCKASGLPVSGPESLMKDVLRRYGYKF